LPLLLEQKPLDKISFESYWFYGEFPRPGGPRVVTRPINHVYFATISLQAVILLMPDWNGSVRFNQEPKVLTCYLVGGSSA
jgi:hypothetical protein